MHRFFTDNIIEDKAILSHDDSQHAVKVLRLKEGDEVTVCDCRGFDYKGTIISADKNSVELQLSDKRASSTESELNVTLIQCLPKTGKMEVIIQKCTELGVSSFIPAVSKRCVVKTDEKSYSSKVERYNKVAYEAAKQSVRGIIPKVNELSTLDSIDYSAFDVVLIPYEEETNTTVKQFVVNCDKLNNPGVRIAIIIGPEGGFEKSEVDNIVNKGGISVTLGKRILRTETAGMATVAMLMGITEK